MINQFKRKFLGRQNINKLTLSLSILFIGIYIGYLIGLIVSAL